jgi:hypothetical protein
MQVGESALSGTSWIAKWVGTWICLLFDVQALKTVDIRGGVKIKFVDHTPRSTSLRLP